MRVVKTGFIDVIERYLSSTSIDRRPTAWTPLESLYEQFQTFCRLSGLPIIHPQEDFQIALQAHGFRTEVAGESVVVVGIDIR